MLWKCLYATLSLSSRAHFQKAAALFPHQPEPFTNDFGDCQQWDLSFPECSSCAQISDMVESVKGALTGFCNDWAGVPELEVETEIVGVASVSSVDQHSHQKVEQC